MATLEAILAGKYPAKSHARRVAENLKTHGHDGPGIIYLEAQKTRLIEDNDEPMPFRYAPTAPLYGETITDHRLSGNVVPSSICQGACSPILI